MNGIQNTMAAISVKSYIQANQSAQFSQIHVDVS